MIFSSAKILSRYLSHTVVCGLFLGLNKEMVHFLALYYNKYSHFCLFGLRREKKVWWQEVNKNFSHSVDDIVYKLRYITWICTHMKFLMEDFLLMNMCVCTSIHFIVTLSNKLSKGTSLWIAQLISAAQCKCMQSGSWPHSSQYWAFRMQPSAGWIHWRNVDWCRRFRVRSAHCVLWFFVQSVW